MTVNPTDDTYRFVFDEATPHARRVSEDDEAWADDISTTHFAAHFSNEYGEMNDDATASDEEFWGADDDDIDEQDSHVKRPPSLWRELVGVLIKVGVVAVVLGLIFTFTHGLARNTDPDMSPTVKAGDLVMFYRLDKNYEIDDLIALRYQGQLQVRRVVAQAGDVVDITADGLTVNGALQQEPDIYEQTQPYQTGIRFPVTVGPGEVFVLGDARDGATDSRVYGPVNTKDTLGKVIAIIKWRDL